MSASHRIILSLIVGAGFAVGVEAGDAPPARPGKYALLVGCTRYPNLKLAYQLRGPANDVLLMRDLLVERFGFAAKDIVILSEEAGDDDRPTKERIRRAFEHLAKVAGKGDQVVIQLSGHGSQQPQQDPDDPESYEPDGLSETFLPADIGSWDDGKKEVANAIVDVELRGWLKAIRAKGASLLLIVDCCHAGGLSRAVDETFREVPAEKLVPEAALKEAARKAQQRGETTRGTDKKPTPFALPRFAPDLAVIYASQSTEPTVELKLPRGSEDAKPYGLLTYTLVQVVRQSAEPLTYRELVQRIQSRYVGMNRDSPTPLVEGKDQDREFLGQREWPGRSRILVKKGEEDADRMVNAGAIHGLTVGSILAVYPLAGEAGGTMPMGHARVIRVRTLNAQVEPCAYAGLPAPKQLPIGGRCDVVFSAYESQRLRVALDESSQRGGTAPPPKWQRVREELGKLDAKPQSLIHLVANPAQADWLVRASGGQVMLVSAAAATNGRDTPPTKSFGPVPLDEHLGEWLEDSLNTVVRTRNLLALAATAAAEHVDPKNGVDIKVELLRYRPEQPRVFDVVEWSDNGRELKKGDRIGFRISNCGRYTADVNLLVVDSDYGITLVFPEEKTIGDERLRPNRTIIVGPWTVNVRTMGLEHVVAIGVKVRPDEQGMDFSFLAQPNLQSARLKAVGDKNRGLNSPLGLLFQNAVYGEGQRRGLTREMANDYAMRLLSWKTLASAADPQSRPNAPKQPTPPTTAPDLASPGVSRDVAPPAPKQDAARGFSWQSALYVGGGVLAGVLLVLLLNRRNTGARNSSDQAPEAP